MKRITITKLLGAILLAALVASGTLADDEPADEPSERAEEPGEEGDELGDLLSILEEETEIATRSRMNRDYVPGIVTVLQRDELQALGIETAWEAVSVVPGIQAARDNLGSPSMVVRGIDFPFNSGNVKVLVDGVPLSWETSAINGSVLFLPIEQVERIEIIRGPGSVVYGDFAFMGLVNIITRREGSGAYLRADTDDAFSGGGHHTWGEPDSPFRATLNLGGYTSDEAAVPLPREADEERVTGSLTLERGELSLAAHAIDREVDVAPGTAPGQAAAHHRETSWSFEPRWVHPFTDRLTSTARLTLLRNELETPGTTFDSTLTEAAFEVRWEVSDKQRLLAGVEAYSAEIDARRAVPPPPGPPRPPPPPLVLDDADRDVKSFLVQDEIDLPGNLQITAGLRYDDVSDIDHRITPRLAAVWRASERHVLKAQHAEGFRAPTFFELYLAAGGLNDLEFETVATTELNWVYTRPGSTFRLTLFHSDLDDMIFIVPGTPVFRNYVEGESQGVELEWEQELTHRLKLISNLSFAETEDGRRQVTSNLPEPPPGQAEADHLGNLALLYRPLASSVVGARWYRVGDREAPGDDAYDLVEVTYTHPDLFAEGLSLRAGVEDVLDEEPVTIRSNPQGFQRLAFPGRRAWLQVAWNR